MNCTTGRKWLGSLPRSSFFFLVKAEYVGREKKNSWNIAVTWLVYALDVEYMKRKGKEEERQDSTFDMLLKKTQSNGLGK